MAIDPPGAPDPLAGLRAAFAEAMTARDLWREEWGWNTEEEAARGRDLDAAWDRWRREMRAVAARLARADALAGAAREAADGWREWARPSPPGVHVPSELIVSMAGLGEALDAYEAGEAAS